MAYDRRRLLTMTEGRMAPDKQFTSGEPNPELRHPPVDRD